MKGPIIATSASATTEIELVSHEEQGLTSEARAYPPLSRWKSFTIIATVTGITILNSMQNGIVTVGLPIIGRDLHLSESLILWFAILGAGQPVGFASGMVLSGVFISKLSWRWAFYCSAIVNLVVVAGAWWGLPPPKLFEPVSFATFWKKVDWIGATLVSTSLGLFFYVLAYVPHSY